MKKVLVTGGSRGIGAATVKKFRDEGYEVVAPSRSELNLLSVESVEAFVKAHADDEFFAIVNNAGINDLGEVDNITDEQLERMLMTNLEAPIRLLRGLVPSMKKNGGRIVNIGSIWAVVSKPGRMLYSATKNAMHGITNTLAVELAPYSILVNTVCPGFTLTELTYQNNSPEQIAAISKDIPMGRMAQPDEIAGLVYFLASEKNTYITGQKITIDGGFTVK